MYLPTLSSTATPQLQDKDSSWPLPVPQGTTVSPSGTSPDLQWDGAGEGETVFGHLQTLPGTEQVGD